MHLALEFRHLALHMILLMLHLVSLLHPIRDLTVEPLQFLGLLLSLKSHRMHLSVRVLQLFIFLEDLLLKTVDLLTEVVFALARSILVGALILSII
jgi:hypothetical protein